MIEINGYKIDPQHYIDKWTNWALEATPATDKEVTENVQWLYANAGLKKPKVRVFRDYDEFANYDWDSVWDSVAASVWDSVKASVADSVKAWVRASVGASVGDSVWDSVGDSVWASVWDSVAASVWDSVAASVGASVGASVRASVGASVQASVGASVAAWVGASVGDSVWASVGDSVWDSVWDSVGASVGAWCWSDDISFADVFVDTKVLSEEKARELDKYKKVLSTQRIAIYTENVCYVLVAPAIRRNKEGFLHSDEFRAVDWGKSGLYYLNGVKFTKELWERLTSHTISFQEIVALEDIDQRTQAMKYGDVDEFLKWSNAKTLDTHIKQTLDGKKINYSLVEIPEKEDLFTETAYFAIYDCPSTDRKYMSGVEKFDTVADAMAWKSFITAEQWLNMIPLIL